MQEVLTVTEVTTLPFGVGLVGADRHLVGAEKTEYIAALGHHQHNVSPGLILPIDCMEDRLFIALANGIKDPSELRARRAYQLAGGRTLATTKAAVAANAAYLRDAKSFTEAFEKTDEILDALGYASDSSHEGCGAEGLVQKSTSQPLGVDVLLETFKELGAQPDSVRKPLEMLYNNKYQRTQAGFYDDWDPTWRANRVKMNHPENFASLRIADDAVKGHWASGVLVVKDGHVFAKNAFIEETGKYSFALTFSIANDIANKIGATDEERALISLGFQDDSFNVANHIVAPGLEVYA